VIESNTSNLNPDISSLSEYFHEVNQSLPKYISKIDSLSQDMK